MKQSLFFSSPDSRRKVLHKTFNPENSIIRSSTTCINKIQSVLSNERHEEIKEFIEDLISNLIDVFYDVELSILATYSVPLHAGKQINLLKNLIYFCNYINGVANPKKIVFPQIFVDEYNTLLLKTNIAIRSVSDRIKKLSLIKDTKPLFDVLEKNLICLNMLKWHYQVIIAMI